MTTISTIDLFSVSKKQSRDILQDLEIKSLDVDGVSGDIIVTNITNYNGEKSGRIVIYPPSDGLQINSPIYITEFAQTREFYSRSLYLPHDAKSDCFMGTIWVADTGNNRLIKFDKRTLQMLSVVENTIIYPYSIAVNLNTGGVFAMGFYNSVNNKVVMHFDSSGTLISSFLYYDFSFDNSSSSSTSSLDSESSSTISSETSRTSYTSSSSSEGMSYFSSSKSICFDHVRNRAWWISKNIIYMIDVSNSQINSYNLEVDGFIDTYSIDVDRGCGNSLVVAKGKDGYKYLLQIFRDNNRLLGISYVNG